jgi:hypothetical protein
MYIYPNLLVPNDLIIPRYKWGAQFSELLVKFKEEVGAVASAVLRRRHASTMTRALLQKSSSTSKITYPAQFSPFTEDQHGLLSAALASPLRQQKAIGTRLATAILITDELGGGLHA